VSSLSSFTPIWRLTPIVIDALRFDLNWYHYILLIVIVLQMAYSEGYRGFQKNFTPYVIHRMQLLREHADWINSLLAPLYCMGYFRANRRDLTAKYALTIGIIILIVIVNQLDQPWRGLIDAGVVVGLGWGLVTLVVGYAHALTTPSQVNDDNQTSSV